MRLFFTEKMQQQWRFVKDVPLNAKGHRGIERGGD